MNKVKAFPLHKKGKKWIQNVLKSKHNKINQQKKKKLGKGGIQERPFRHRSLPRL